MSEARPFTFPHKPLYPTGVAVFDDTPLFNAGPCEPATKIPRANQYQTYFIHNPTTNHIKIGRSTNPQERLIGLQVGSPHQLILLGTLAGDHEKEWRDEFKAEGAWFIASEALMQAVKSRVVAPRAQNLGHRPGWTGRERAREWWASLAPEKRAARALVTKQRRLKARHEKLVARTWVAVRAEAIRRRNDSKYATEHLRSYVYCRRFIFCNAPLHPTNAQLQELRSELDEARSLGGPAWEAKWNTRVIRRESAIQRKLNSDMAVKSQSHMHGTPLAEVADLG